jgi:DNA-binding HxlR family transcriptional regulator
VEYELTELGQSLAPVLLSMRDWGERLKETEAEAMRDGGQIAEIISL